MKIFDIAQYVCVYVYVHVCVCGHSAPAIERSHYFQEFDDGIWYARWDQRFSDAASPTMAWSFGKDE